MHSINMLDKNDKKLLTPDTKLELIVSPLRSLSINLKTAFVTFKKREKRTQT